MTPQRDDRPEGAAMDLTGKLLIAMPTMSDPRFARSVVYMCSHTPEGAMGLIVNKPDPGVAFHGLLAQIGITPMPGARDIRVHFGGPVEMGRGFVLHSDDYRSDHATLCIPGGVGMTGSVDILEELAAGRGPGAALMALGYSGWGPGQLEQEILRNDWLTSDAPGELLFSRDDDAKWSAALALIGVDPMALSGRAGRA